MDELQDSGHDVNAKEYFHRRGYDAVLAKIKKLYKVDEDKLALPESLASQLNDRWDVSFSSKKWVDVRDRAINESQPHTIAPEQLDAYAKKLANEYSEAMHLRIMLRSMDGESLQQPYNKGFESRVYDNDETKKKLTSVLINHISNRAESELRTMGLDAQSAHILHSNILGFSVGGFRDVTGKSQDEAYISPMLGRFESAHDEPEEFQWEIKDRRQRLGNHWKDLGKRLDTYYRNEKDGSFER
jgi:hypothetical protein